MANEYGPTVEPGWIGGARMPGQPDLVGAFQNAWQIHSAANNRARQMENQLAAMQLRAEQTQHERGMDAEKFQLARDKMTWDAEKFYTDQERLRAATKASQDYRDATLDIKQQRFDISTDLKKRQSEATEGANQVFYNLFNEGITPGTRKFNTEWVKRLEPYMAVEPATVGIIRDNKLQASNNARDQMKRSIQVEEEAFAKAVGREIGGGNTLNQNYNVFENPQDLKDEWGGGFLGIRQVKTGRKYVPITDAAGNAGQQAVDMNKLMDLKRRHDALKAKEDDLADPVNLPDVGVQSALPMPADPKDRQVNQIYTNPSNGRTGRWTGTGWIPVGE